MRLRVTRQIAQIGETDVGEATAGKRLIIENISHHIPTQYGQPRRIAARDECAAWKTSLGVGVHMVIGERCIFPFGGSRGITQRQEVIEIRGRTTDNILRHKYTAVSA